MTIQKFERESKMSTEIITEEMVDTRSDQDLGSSIEPLPERIVIKRSSIKPSRIVESPTNKYQDRNSSPQASFHEEK